MAENVSLPAEGNREVPLHVRPSAYRPRRSQSFPTAGDDWPGVSAMAAGVSIRIQALLLLLFCGAALAGVLYLAGEGHRQGLRADAAHQLEELAREIDHFGRHHLEDF
ncbi:MAG: hypothetical protein AB1568_17705, partial [Thermodesulfobacteriota bacterium]